MSTLHLVIGHGKPFENTSVLRLKQAEPKLHVMDTWLVSWQEIANLLAMDVNVVTLISKTKLEKSSREIAFQAINELFTVTVHQPGEPKL